MKNCVGTTSRHRNSGQQCQRRRLLLFSISVLVICSGFYLFNVAGPAGPGPWLLHSLRQSLSLRGPRCHSRPEIRPPELTARQNKTVRPLAEHLDGFDAINLTLTSSFRSSVLDVVSGIVQSQIQTLQSPSAEECARLPAIVCGHSDGCGLGCQAHHRVACLMTSYAIGVPLIHDETQAWPFRQRWSDMYEPLGATSNCHPGPNTFTIDWVGVGKKPNIYKTDLAERSSGETFKHPLLDGLPVPAALASIVEQVHPNPFLWWVGQFMKYGLRLRPEIKARVDQDKESIGFNESIAGASVVGFQVRRTDKVNEFHGSVHDLSEYFDAADKILGPGAGKTKAKTVFIASDDHFVLGQAHEEYRPPTWNVLSFPSSQTLQHQWARANNLYSIVRDVAVLSECDFVVCGYSSNICRLLLEILSERFGAEDARHRVRSLDEGVEYSYVYASVLPERVLKV